MLSSPKIGARVELRYRQSFRSVMPHGQRGNVVIVGRSRPRNHAVKLDSGRVAIVPAGNLIAANEQGAE